MYKSRSYRQYRSRIKAANVTYKLYNKNAALKINGSDYEIELYWPGFGDNGLKAFTQWRSNAGNTSAWISNVNVPFSDDFESAFDDFVKSTAEQIKDNANRLQAIADEIASAQLPSEVLNDWEVVDGRPVLIAAEEKSYRSVARRAARRALARRLNRY